MSAERIYTVAELLALYEPSEIPDNFADFGQFGSIESVPPIGDNKPIIEQKPHRKSFPEPQDGEHVDSEQRRNEPTRYNQNKQKQHNVAPKKQQVQPKKMLPKDTVKVEAEFASMDFSWGKSKNTEPAKTEPAPAAPVHAPPPVAVAAPQPKPAEPPGPVINFNPQQAKRVVAPSFAEILNTEPEHTTTTKPFVPAFKPRNIKDEEEANSVPTFAPKVVETPEPAQQQMRFDPPRERRGFNPKPYEPYIPGQAKVEERREDFRTNQFKPYTPAQPAWAPIQLPSHSPPPAPADDDFPALGEKPREKPKEKVTVVTSDADFPTLGAAPVHAAPKRTSAWSKVNPN